MNTIPSPDWFEHTILSCDWFKHTILCCDWLQSMAHEVTLHVAFVHAFVNPSLLMVLHRGIRQVRSGRRSYFLLVLQTKNRRSCRVMVKAPTRACLPLLTYVCLPVPMLAYFCLPSLIPFWVLLGLTGPYLVLLGFTESYWALLGLTGPNCLTWPYLTLLGLTGPYL